MRIFNSIWKCFLVVVMVAGLLGCNSSKSTAANDADGLWLSGGTAKVCIAGYDVGVGNSNEISKTLEKMVSDRLKTEKNIQIVSLEEADYMITICPLVNAAVNKVMNRNLVNVSYGFVRFSNKTTFQNMAVVQLNDIKELADDIIAKNFMQELNLAPDKSSGKRISK